MYKETVFSREDLHSAMDALDRLGKEYTIKRINAVEEEDGKLSLLMSKVKNPERFDRWVIEEISTNVIKETFYCDHGTTMVVEEG